MPHDNCISEDLKVVLEGRPTTIDKSIGRLQSAMGVCEVLRCYMHMADGRWMVQAPAPFPALDKTRRQGNMTRKNQEDEA